MALYAARGSRPEAAAPDRAEIAHALAGNLCRCTGYGPIRRALRKAAKANRRST